MEAEDVRQTSRRDAVRQAGHRIRVDARQVALRLEIAVIGRAQSEEDAAAAAIQLVGRLAGVLERLPADLEQQPLLRIHVDGFTRRDAEKLRLEPIHLREACRPARVHLAERIRVGVEVRVDIPPLAWNLRHRVHAVPQHLPERLRRIGPAREPAADSDDGDRLAFGSLHGLELCFHLLQREQRALERRERSKTIRLIRGRHRYSFPSFSSSSASASSSLICSMRAAAADRSASSTGATAASRMLKPRTSRSRYAASASIVG